MEKSNIPLVLRLLDVFSIVVIVCSRITEILEDHDSQLQCEDADEGLIIFIEQSDYFVSHFALLTLTFRQFELAD